MCAAVIRRAGSKEGFEGLFVVLVLGLIVEGIGVRADARLGVEVD